MTVTDEQFEWIVREVVRRLQALGAFNGPTVASNATLPPPPPPTPENATLILQQQVIATESLRGRLEGVRRLEVLSKAVVTPAARDMLRDCGVQLARRAMN